jgi:hypothetical protein
MTDLLETTPTTDLFGETADEIRADEEQWVQQFAASRKDLRAMARDAAEDYRAGKTRLFQACEIQETQNYA